MWYRIKKLLGLVPKREYKLRSTHNSISKLREKQDTCINVHVITNSFDPNKCNYLTVAIHNEHVKVTLGNEERYYILGK